jgi:arsenate reductase
MAEAFFNKHSKGWKAISAGIEPDDTIHPYTVRLMKEVGIDASKKKPKLLTPEMIEKADIIITMCSGINIPTKHLTKVEDWMIEEPYGKSIAEVREIRGQIREKVEKLVQKIEFSR